MQRELDTPPAANGELGETFDETTRLNPRDSALYTLSRQFSELPDVLMRVREHEASAARHEHFSDDIVNQYLRDIATYRLLTPEEEVTLFTQIEAGIQQFTFLGGQLDSLSPEQLQIYVDAVAARQIVFHTNLRLCVSIARPFAAYVRDKLPLMDLIQEANTGLAKAINRFEIAQGNKFSTYATWWIRQHVTRYIADSSRIIRLPVHLHERYLKAQKATRKLESELQRNLTAHEIEEATGMSIGAYNHLMRAGNDLALSFDALMNDDTKTEFIDLFTPADDQMERVAVDLSHREELANLMHSTNIPDREKAILGLRYGLEEAAVGNLELDIQGKQVTYGQLLTAMQTTDGLTLETIGEIFSVTKERIRQLEQKALKRLRGTVMAKGFSGKDL